MSNFKPMFKGKEKLVLQENEIIGYKDILKVLQECGSLYFVNSTHSPEIKIGDRGLFVVANGQRVSGILIVEKDRIKLIQKELDKRTPVENLTLKELKKNKPTIKQL
jgi:hypothetical protein